MLYTNLTQDFFLFLFLENGKRKRTLDITDSRQGILGSPSLPPPPHSSLYHKSSVQTSPPLLSSLTQIFILAAVQLGVMKEE
jgi:hypothetical protein